MVSEKSIIKVDRYLSELRKRLLVELEIGSVCTVESSIEISQGGVKDKIFLDLKTSHNISLKESKHSI